MLKKFNVRVYGLLIENNALLVSDEYIKGNKITKFVGGGLDFGEGLKEGLAREFKEELDLDVEVTEHFYTTDFFVLSAFDTKSQVISIYYYVKAKQPLTFKTSEKLFDFINKPGAQSLRWISLSQLKENDFTLIIDRRAAELLIKTL